MTPAALYVLAAMCAWIAPRDWQRHDYDLIAQAIVDATPDPEDEIQLAAIASYESRFAVHAVGKLHEQGPWQLLGRVPPTLTGQAKEALRRWKTQGRCSYTGEANRADGKCPLADHRYLRARLWSYQHPFTGEEPGCAARMSR